MKSYEIEYESDSDVELDVPPPVPSTPRTTKSPPEVQSVDYHSILALTVEINEGAIVMAQQIAAGSVTMPPEETVESIVELSVGMRRKLADDKWYAFIGMTHQEARVQVVALTKTCLGSDLPQIEASGIEFNQLLHSDTGLTNQLRVRMHQTVGKKVTTIAWPRLSQKQTMISPGKTRGREAVVSCTLQ